MTQFCWSLAAVVIGPFLIVAVGFAVHYLIWGSP